MTETAYERIIAALHRHGSTVRERGEGQATAQCPAHDDGNPSLSVTAAAENALMHCFAGCNATDVLAALGMTMRDLYDNPRETTYSYVDRDGVINRTVTRKVQADGKKKFFQSITGDGVILYRLPDVAAAVELGQPVYLVEGEKDADNARTLTGVAATTAPQGASNFRHVDVSPLEGAHVVAVVDRDTAGDKWARDVAAKLEHVAASLTFMEATIGNDLSDHLAAGKPLDGLTPYRMPVQPSQDDTGPSNEEGRHLVVTSAAEIKPRRVTWAWQDRIALGTLSLLAGKEGLGKSTLAVNVAAQVTRGTLPGSNEGKPRAVIYAATEDSWEHTIIPRLIAAGADLNRVYRVEVATATGFTTGLNLPRDISALQDVVTERDVALMILDPIMSRLDNLDTHKDAEVRQALEPLVRMADETGMAILGLIHLNKSSHDPLNAVMGSKAFTAVARSVLSVVPDPDDETEQRRLFGVVKNNLARVTPSSTAFTVESAPLDLDGETITTGRVHWHGDSATSIKTAMSDPGIDTQGVTEEAAEWLSDYLTMHGEVASKDARRDGTKEGFSDAAIRRAARKLGVKSEYSGFPRTSRWSLPAQSAQSAHDLPGETSINEHTEPTGLSQRKVGIQSAQSAQSDHVSKTDELTGEPTAFTALRCSRCSRMMTTPPAGEPYCTNHECETT
ncbi:AAA family ATPase [Flaviflexus huanghaiensis]|uniref:AAA family ATPase n=1 Tax=Flaviflexus huanghaiensis TaxID=1111473 RepID=UPI0015FD211F|nr:AAA family ATPase [Flaviflexus huanghaiensis]